MYPGKIDGTFKGRKVQIYPPPPYPTPNPQLQKEISKKVLNFFFTATTNNRANRIILKWNTVSDYGCAGKNKTKTATTISKRNKKQHT